MNPARIGSGEMITLLRCQKPILDVEANLARSGVSPLTE